MYTIATPTGRPTLRQEVRQWRRPRFVKTRDNLHRVILGGRIPSRGPRGRPRFMWIDNIGDWVGRKHYGWLVRKAQDREKWRQFIPASLQQVDGAQGDEEVDKAWKDRQLIFVLYVHCEFCRLTVFLVPSLIL